MPLGKDGPTLPALVFFHGGGFVIADAKTYDASTRALADTAGCVVISVDYRRAPENKFPAAPEDAYAATQDVINNAARFNVDPKKVAVGGESAGGNLATVVCLMAKERKGEMPVHQLLIYPVTDWKSERPSHTEYGGSPVLPEKTCRGSRACTSRTRTMPGIPSLRPSTRTISRACRPRRSSTRSATCWPTTARLTRRSWSRRVSP